VIYDREQQRDLLIPVISRFAQALTDTEDELGIGYVSRSFIPSCIWRVTALIWECVLCFKHPGFCEEREWRGVLIRNVRRSSPLERAVRRAPYGFVRYVQLPIGSRTAVPIKRIVVGPSPHPELARRGAEVLVELSPIGTPEVIGSDVPLKV
jgi:hypothetical protein